ncbi:MAG: hypothetical protein O3B84_07655 [Chloroflexi bacterium]|nr:hypothetical protein [Chloroflexota bacterium]
MRVSDLVQLLARFEAPSVDRALFEVGALEDAPFVPLHVRAFGERGLLASTADGRTALTGRGFQILESARRVLALSRGLRCAKSAPR